MARFLKFKFLIILKLNFNGGQFYKKINRQLLMFCAKKLGHWMDGCVEGWMEGW